jgi:hypothetical protein
MLKVQAWVFFLAFTTLMEMFDDISEVGRFDPPPIAQLLAHE